VLLRQPCEELISGTVEEGWVLFETGGDVAVDDVEVRVERNDVRVTWGCTLRAMATSSSSDGGHRGRPESSGFTSGPEDWRLRFRT